MATYLRLNIVASMSNLINVQRYAKHNRSTLVEAAAQRYVNFLRSSYIRRSAGGGGWPGLAESTIKSKESRGIAENPSAILRESDTLLDLLDAQQTSDGYEVGYFDDSTHSRGHISIFELVEVHTYGIGKNLPERPIIVDPDGRTESRMRDDILKSYNKVIRANRRKK